MLGMVLRRARGRQGSASSVPAQGKGDKNPPQSQGEGHNRDLCPEGMRSLSWSSGRAQAAPSLPILAAGQGSSVLPSPQRIHLCWTVWSRDFHLPGRTIPTPVLPSAPEMPFALSSCLQEMLQTDFQSVCEGNLSCSLHHPRLCPLGWWCQTLGSLLPSRGGPWHPVSTTPSCCCPSPSPLPTEPLQGHHTPAAPDKVSLRLENLCWNSVGAAGLVLEKNNPSWPFISS